MKAHTASLVNAILLVGLGLWGAIGSASPTAFIPVGVGVILLLLNGGVKKENKVVAHIAVLLTLLILIGLIRPLMGVLEKEDTMGILRVGVMLLSTVVAMIYFIKSFIDARKNRAAE